MCVLVCMYVCGCVCALPHGRSLHDVCVCVSLKYCMFNQFHTQLIQNKTCSLPPLHVAARGNLHLTRHANLSIGSSTPAVYASAHNRMFQRGRRRLGCTSDGPHSKGHEGNKIRGGVVNARVFVCFPLASPARSRRGEGVRGGGGGSCLSCL